MRKSDQGRIAAKVEAVAKRLNEIHTSFEPVTLLGMIEEHKLDMLILALGLGDVKLNEEGV